MDLRALALRVPRRAPFDPVKRFEAVADGPCKLRQRTIDAGVQLGTCVTVRAIKHVVDHCEFLSLLSASKRQRKSVEQIVGRGPKRLLDQLQPELGLEREP